MRIFFALPFLVLYGTRIGATVLSDLAASLNPGEWAELKTTGLTLALLEDVGGHHILQYSDEAKWDPATKRFLYLGQGHSSNWDSNPSTHSRFIAYSDATNSWSTLADIPSGENNIGHAYDHSALDEARGYFYHRPYSSRSVYRYSIGNNTWTNIADLSTSVLDYNVCCMALEHVPGMGGLILTGGGHVCFYNPTNNSWTSLRTSLPMSGYCNFTEYDPVRRVLLFGGKNDLHQMDTLGRISTLNNSPVATGPCEPWQVTTTDPVSGKMLVLATDEKLYEYDHVQDKWTVQPGPTPPVVSANYCSNRTGCMVAAPVSTYGVNMYLVWNWENSKAFIYKHSASVVGAEAASPAGSADGIVISPNPVSRGEAVNLRVTGRPLIAARLGVYDLRGQKIAALGSPARGGSLTWNPSNAASGLYLIKAKSGGREVTKRVLVER